MAQVPAYAGFVVEELPLERFRKRWLTGLERDGIRVGLNWTGTRATGYDVAAVDVDRNLAAATNRRAPSQTRSLGPALEPRQRSMTGRASSCIWAIADVAGKSGARLLALSQRRAGCALRRNVLAGGGLRCDVTGYGRPASSPRRRGQAAEARSGSRPRAPLAE